MSKDTSRPAFPTVDANYQDFGATGMTLRQYAAIKAMQGVLANSDGISRLGAYAAKNGQQLADVVATAAVLHADALLAELEK